MAGKRESRETWATRVERWKDSGLNAQEYAAEIGVNANTLKFWSYRLGSDSKNESSSDAGHVAQRRKQGRKKRPEFVEVTPRVVDDANGAVEIVIGDLVVRVVNGFHEETLTRVLAMVRSSS